MSEGVRIFEHAIETARSTRGTPQGTVRISTPVELGLYLIENVMPGFFEKYPLVKVEWDLSGEKRNLIHHRLDLAVRAGQQPDESSMIARKMGSVRFSAFVSPTLKLPKFKTLDSATPETTTDTKAAPKK
jgi:DNA-binding transcriptional LysR family regulator